MSAGPGMARLARVIREFCSWAPVWIPLVLVAQIGIRGLRPALAEERRLDRAETGLEKRHADSLEERNELERRLRAQEDAVYQERERRTWEQRAGEPTGAPAASGILERRDESER